MSQDKNEKKITDNSVAVNTMPNSKNENNMNKSNLETAFNTPDTGANNLVNITNQDNIRFNMVNKATKFLMATSTAKNSSIDKKIHFLRSKGLTDPEIELAIETVMANGQNQNTQTLPLPVNYNSSNVVQMQLTSRNWFRQFVGPITCAVLGVYFGYHVYKKYVEKWLFGMRKSPIEKRLKVVEVLVQRCVLLLEDKNITSEFRNQKNEFDKMRDELKSIKSLLLNRSQFPPAPATSSIPHWQLLKNTKPQADQHNRVVANNVNMPNTSLFSIFNEQSNSPFSVVGSHTTGSVDGDIVDKNCPSINDSMPNGIMSPISSDEKMVKVEVVNDND